MGKPPENSHGNPEMKVWIQMMFLFKQTRSWTQVNQPLIVQGVTKLQKKLTRQDMAGQCHVSIWSRLGRFQKKHRHIVSLQVLIMHYTESPCVWNPNKRKQETKTSLRQFQAPFDFWSNQNHRPYWEGLAVDWWIWELECNLAEQTPAIHPASRLTKNTGNCSTCDTATTPFLPHPQVWCFL